jgi:hypothetical protein
LLLFVLKLLGRELLTIVALLLALVPSWCVSFNSRPLLLLLLLMQRPLLDILERGFSEQLHGSLLEARLQLPAAADEG